MNKLLLFFVCVLITNNLFSNPSRNWSGDNIISNTPDSYIESYFPGAVNAEKVSDHDNTANEVIASEDAFVRGGTYSNDNYGSNDNFVVRKSVGDENYERRAYLKFDLSNFPVSEDPVRLKLKVRDITATAKQSIHFVASDSWTEEGITWNNQPSCDTIAHYTDSVSEKEDWIVFDVTELVRGEMEGDDTLSVCIISNTADAFVRYHSSEASNADDRPVLFMETNTISCTIYVDDSGDDNGTGTIDSPFKTIQKAADIAMPGDTVYVFEGTYRERVAPPRGGTEDKAIVYYGEPDKNVLIKGSDVWSPEWTKKTGNVFYAIPEESMFNDDCYVDDKNPFKVAVSSTPYELDGKPEVERGYGGDSELILSIGQVFVEGKLYMQKGYLNQTIDTPESWFVNQSSGEIYIHFPDGNPSTHNVEISTRRRIFAPHKRGLGYIVVEGFVMEHCGNQYPTNFWEAEHPEWQQAGAIGTRSGHHWIIKNNVIRLAHGIGIDFGNEGNKYVDLETGDNGEATGSGYHIIDSNYITDNGGGGTAAYSPRNITFTNNIVERNNNLRFVGKKRWESAGVKMHGPHYSIISNNLIRNNYGKWGLWLDQGSGDDTQVHGNLIVGNEVGFDLEIGTAYKDKLILDNNIFINNKTAIASRESGGITAMNNLVVNSPEYGVHNTINKNRSGSWSGDNHYYFNNVLINCGINMGIYPPDFYRSEVRQMDYNIYQEYAGEKRFKLLYTMSNFNEWKTQWMNYNASSNADMNSILNNQLSCDFDSVNLTIQLNVNDAFFLPKTKVHTKLKQDFTGQEIPADSSALPGPFQELKQGQNQLSLWSGLSPLEKYEMPYEDISTATEETFHPDKQLKVYPNPTTGILNLQAGVTFSQENYTVEVFNMVGKMVITKHIDKSPENDHNEKLNLNGLIPGMYLVVVRNTNRFRQSKIILLNQ